MGNHRRARIAIGALCASLAAVPVLAAAQPEPSPAPSPSPSVAPAVQRGVVFRGHIVAESAATLSGGIQSGTAFASEIMLGSDVDFGRFGHSDAGTLHLTITAREGSSLSANAIGNIFTVQEIYGSGLTPRLTEASYEQPLRGGKLDLLLGRIITESDFGASPNYWGGNLYCENQSNAICGTPIAVPINSGYDAYPQSVWGARIKVAPASDWYVQSGAYQVDPAYGARGNGFNLGFSGTTGTYVPIEAGLMMLGPDKVARGSVRAGGYYDTSNVATVEAQAVRFSTPGNVVMPDALPRAFFRGRYGYWAQADALIAGSAARNGRGTAMYAAYNYGDNKTALLTNFFDAGIVQHGTLRGRDNDTIAVGYAYGNVNPNLRAFEESIVAAGLNAPVNGQEQIGELNYGVQLRPWLTVRPGLQYVWRPSGNAAIRNAFVFDLSTAINF